MYIARFHCVSIMNLYMRWSIKVLHYLYFAVFLQDDDTTCSLALSSQGSNTDLDPLVDSLDLEFGYNLTDAGGRRSNMTGQSSRHLHNRQVQPSPLATTAARAPHAQSSRSTPGKVRCIRTCTKPIKLIASPPCMHVDPSPTISHTLLYYCKLRIFRC